MENGTGNNGVDSATMMHFVREQSAIDSQIKALQAKRKNFRSSVKSNGIKLKNFDRVYDEFNAADDDQYLEDLRQQRNMARLLDMPLGTQISFFDEAGDRPATVSTGGAYQQGRRAFLLLVKENQNPFTDGDQHQDWLRGFREAEAQAKAGKDRASGAVKAAKEPPIGRKSSKSSKNSAAPKKRGRPRKIGVVISDIGKSPLQ